ncbi:hypothetical protein Goklo_002653, partial [Gossypium klotzschianum]|nr:hypothetical protein [Gossypium klotzschianum]
VKYISVVFLLVILIVYNIQKAHKKYEPFLKKKSIDHYDEMTLVVGKDMETRSFSRTFANID